MDDFTVMCMAAAFCLGTWVSLLGLRRRLIHLEEQVWTLHKDLLYEMQYKYAADIPEQWRKNGENING